MDADRNRNVKKTIQKPGSATGTCSEIVGTATDSVKCCNRVL